MAVAPESVKVRARMAEGSVSVCLRILAMRVAMIWVLPVPGPAMTMTGPSIEVTASLWAGLRESKAFWKAGVSLGRLVIEFIFTTTSI